MPKNALFNPQSLKKYTLLAGHYGSGKTNCAMQLAFDLSAAGKKVTLVDLDIVNPYFRSSDYSAALDAAHIEVIGPNFARTALDTPSLSPRVQAVFESQHNADYVIFDVGGDDAGATALGRYHRYFESVDYQMIGVINHFRNLTQTAEETCAVLGEIETACSLTMSALINNSHVHKLTTLPNIEEGERYAREVSEQCGKELLCSTIPANLLSQTSGVKDTPLKESVLYPIKIHVQTPWDADASVLGG